MVVVLCPNVWVSCTVPESEEQAEGAGQIFSAMCTNEKIYFAI